MGFRSALIAAFPGTRDRDCKGQRFVPFQKSLLFAAQNAGCSPLFLPPHSPELNPIEKFWAWLKRFLRKILSSATSLDEALCTAFQLR